MKTIPITNSNEKACGRGSHHPLDDTRARAVQKKASTAGPFVSIQVNAQPPAIKAAAKSVTNGSPPNLYIA